MLNVSKAYDWERMKAYVKESLKDDKSSHDYPHILRVCKNVELICEGLEFDADVLMASALLHDIAFSLGPQVYKTHHIDGAKMSRVILPSYGFSEEQIERIYHCIINHSRSFRTPHDPVEKLSLEAKILFDADTIDAIGAIGLVRMIQFSTAQKWPLITLESNGEDKVDESLYGNLKYLNKMMGNLILEPSKRIAEERMKLVNRLVEQLREELL